MKVVLGQRSCWGLQMQYFKGKRNALFVELSEVSVNTHTKKEILWPFCKQGWLTASGCFNIYFFSCYLLTYCHINPSFACVCVCAWLHSRQRGQLQNARAEAK